MARKKSESKLRNKAYLGKFDLNEYYKRIIIRKVKNNRNNVKGKIFMVKIKDPKELRLGKETFLGEIDLIEYFRKCLIREMNKERRTYYID